MHFKFRRIIKGILQTEDFLFSFFSTFFDTPGSQVKLLAKFVEQCVSNSFDTSFRHQISTIFYKKFCRILSKLPGVNRKMRQKFVEFCRLPSFAGEIYCRNFLAKNTVEKYCLSFSNDVEKRCRILDSTTFFYSIRHFYTKNSCRKTLAKILVEKRWRKM